jgi:hypothetical protein
MIGAVFHAIAGSWYSADDAVDVFLLWLQERMAIIS